MKTLSQFLNKSTRYLVLARDEDGHLLCIAGSVGPRLMCLRLERVDVRNCFVSKSKAFLYATLIKERGEVYDSLNQKTHVITKRSVFVRKLTLHSEMLSDKALNQPIFKE